MKIQLCSVLVDDQAKALAFYTDVLGFVLKHDIPIGEARWLTVVAPDGPDDVELILEPNSNPAAQTYQKALFEQGIPLTAFAVDNINHDYESLQQRGVEFTMEPTTMGATTIAIFNDTCGNLIQVYQINES